MAKPEKLYERLDLLEAEFRDLLIAEFEVLASGGPSSFLFVDWYTQVLFMDGKWAITPFIARWSSTRQEIVMLRQKLGESDGGVTEVLERYVREERYPSEFRIAAAKRALATLRAEESSKQA